MLIIKHTKRSKSWPHSHLVDYGMKETLESTIPTSLLPGNLN